MIGVIRESQTHPKFSFIIVVHRSFVELYHQLVLMSIVCLANTQEGRVQIEKAPECFKCSGADDFIAEPLGWYRRKYRHVR